MPLRRQKALARSNGVCSFPSTPRPAQSRAVSEQAACWVLSLSGRAESARHRAVCLSPSLPPWEFVCHSCSWIRLVPMQPNGGRATPPPPKRAQGLRGEMDTRAAHMPLLRGNEAEGWEGAGSLAPCHVVPSWGPDPVQVPVTIQLQPSV